MLVRTIKTLFYERRRCATEIRRHVSMKVHGSSGTPSSYTEPSERVPFRRTCRNKSIRLTVTQHGKWFEDFMMISIGSVFICFPLSASIL